MEINIKNVAKREEFLFTLLQRAEIFKGARVLDVGCGMGDVSRLIANMVGESGEVIGFDLRETVLEIAREKTKEQGYKNIKFIQSDIMNLPLELGKFDFIVGRRVLMYVPSAENSVNHLKNFLKEDGKIIFQESDCGCLGLNGENYPFTSKLIEMMWATVKAESGNIKIGSSLYEIFKGQGLNIEFLTSQVQLNTVETGTDIPIGIQYMEGRMIERNIVKQGELDLQKIKEEVEMELKNTKTPLIRDLEFGVCAKF